ncbi:hypothetical protein [Lacicoccus alkaliphilus]|uniref:Uncharacterized protein n=1 Tax=Lacicoccus alkaliphilus DSM 16010 TaxID=1123231 RepID=A0A1M7ANC6_9BACL|nr:hypothetical protein [Salinicoccus alkaliphilus]SHL44302.1 hypothetical protein SAMN02745189_00210 [Salinicoccus alkaliphilus DSM 16010]
MKKRFLLMTMFTLVLILSACNGDEEDAGSSEEGSGETADTTETTEETTEESSGNGEEDREEANGEPETSADELIDAAQDEWGETDSYELNQVFLIEDGDTSDAVRMITTHSDQDELKVAINHIEATVTHYIFEDEHHIYSGNQFEQQAEAMDIDGTAYRDLISDLDRYRSGGVERSEDGYELMMQVEDAEDAENLMSEEMADLLQAADDVSGEITLTFDEEYRYTGGEMTAVLVNDGEETELSSTFTIENINNIPVIEKPSGM